MTDISAHGDEAETAEAKRIIEMERLMEEEGVKCFVVMAADAPLGTRVGRAVRVLAPDGAESDKHLFPESCLQDDWTDDYAKSEAFAAEYRAVTDPDDGQKWPKAPTRHLTTTHSKYIEAVRGLGGAVGHRISKPRQARPLAEGLFDSESSEEDQEICTGRA